MTLSDEQKRLYSGDFNHIAQEWQADGSCVVRFWRTGEAERVEMHVTDLYGPSETVVSAETVVMVVDSHIKARQAEASAAVVKPIPSPGGP